jgi:hypothetical protein
VLKFATGFDWMVTTGTSSANAAFSQWGWYGLPELTHGVLQVRDTGRFGGKCLSISNSSTSNERTQASYLIPHGYSHDIWFQGAAMYVPADYAFTKPFIGIGNTGTALMTASFSTFGTVELWLGRYNKPLGQLLAVSAAGVYYNNAWNYLEMGGLLIDDTSGYVEVRVNTVPVISIVSTNTGPVLQAFNSYMVGYQEDVGLGQSQTDVLWDDLYLTDNQGSYNTSYLGNVRVQTQVPASNSSSISWSAFPALTPNWEAASNEDIDDTSYVYSSIVDDYDLYNITPILNSPQVFGITVRGAYRQTDATQRSVANLIESGSDQAEGTEFFTPSTFSFSSDVFETDPATDIPWVYTDINLLKIGPKLKS